MGLLVPRACRCLPWVRVNSPGTPTATTEPTVKHIEIQNEQASDPDCPHGRRR